ncbi:uncharacterized membrane protein YraQ (UPF0718 family) [Rhodovulum iodosum]|uniref:Uncharacterized membrane protein YraQ (UPF0718 family) n=1 Tax=Rhodovulum iodosum TaxID=68291 RepID=A0ABV3XNI3_9RHOB|nr:hypothetical protein [Rhodovulum robiginosum]RSK35811.1 hypothetical protein EJA01_05535 [Rhodovulum robiginosum]
MNIAIGTVLLWALALELLRRLRRQDPARLVPVYARTRAMMVFMIPRIFVGLVGAGFLAALLPVDQIERFFGAESGVAGMGLATILGAVTPGGPFVAFAIGAAALKAGAGWAALMAYVTAWSVVNLNRSIAYELPLMGRRFLMIRALVSLPLPLVLGGIMLLV